VINAGQFLFGHMDNITAKVKASKNVYIHNDLQNSAFWFKNLIEEKLP
jgi:hypothetical protein